MRFTIADHLIELPAWVAGTQFGRALAPFATSGEEERSGAKKHSGENKCPGENAPSGVENLFGENIDVRKDKETRREKYFRAEECSGRDNHAGSDKSSGQDNPSGADKHTPYTLREDGTPVLILNCGQPVPPAGPDYRELDAFDFPDAEAVCRFGRDAQGHRFLMHLDNGETVSFVRSFSAAEVVSNITPAHDPSLLRFGLWMLFGLAVNPYGSVAVHSSVICTGEGAVLFLGESGTGKSTHTRLWREHIPGATLLNDDSPILRIKDGIPTVYGSPWSGKTPCYKAVSSPIRGIVRLSQTPHNRIRRLPSIAALGALLPSCPPAFAFDGELQDHICATLSALIVQVPVYHLECLPDAAAAELSFSTVFPPKP